MHRAYTSSHCKKEGFRILYHGRSPSQKVHCTSCSCCLTSLSCPEQSWKLYRGPRACWVSDPIIGGIALLKVPRSSLFHHSRPIGWVASYPDKDFIQCNNMGGQEGSEALRIDMHHEQPQYLAIAQL